MPNKVSPETSARTPLLGETPSTSSINHFDDDGPPIEYSKLLQSNRPTLVKIGTKMRIETSFDFSSLLEPINIYIDDDCEPGKQISSEVSVERIEKCNQQKIIYYLAHLQSQSRQREVDFTRLDSLLAMGADVNARTSQGLTPLHQSVVTFPLSLAEWLIERGAEIDSVDQWGWTVLHLACIENRPDLVNLLCKLDYNLMHKQTHIMNQTPLHIAALSDTNDVIGELVHHMKTYLANEPDRENVFRAWLELADYQGRTALHLATQYDRSKSAKYLLEHSLAYAATFDSYNQFCMVQMIEKMSFVATIALDQFYERDVLTRKQLFYLHFLEKKTNLDVTRTPLDSVVQFKRFDLILHPIFQKLLNVKWRMYGFAFAIFQTIFYLTNLIFWSVFTVIPPTQERYLYNLPTDIWRIVVGFLCLAFLFIQIVEEFTELTKDISEERHFTKKMQIVYKKDEKYFPDYLTTEHEHIKSLMKDLNRLKKNLYTGDFWNYVDWTAYILMTATAVTHIVDIAAHSTVLADWHARISVVTLIIIWFRLLKYLRPFEFIGWFIAILIYLKSDIFRFVIFILTLLIPYSLGFWILFPLKGELHTFQSTFFTVFRLIVVDDYPLHEILSADEFMTYFMVGTYIAIVSIISLNLFIALLSNTFQTVYDNSQATAVMEKARLLLSTEKKLPYQLLKYYYNRIHQKCAPLLENFDDKTDQPNVDSTVKLATLNILSTVKGMNHTLEDFIKHSSGHHSPHHEENEHILEATRFENLLFALNENISNVAATVDNLNKKIGKMEEKLDTSSISVKPK